MKQDHLESSPIRNLTCRAENGNIGSPTSTAIVGAVVAGCWRGTSREVTPEAGRRNPVAGTDG
ncbi:hypothetical protein ACWENA_26290, partial [Streptomyces sp. NPDC004779]